MHIYKITNLVNGKVYIGKTTRKQPSLRWNEHKYRARLYKHNKDTRSQVITKAIAKYGVDNFTFEVIFSARVTLTELAHKETEFILDYKSWSPYGYNVEVSQAAQEITQEWRNNISKAQQGRQKKKNKVNTYVGVFKNQKRFVMELSKNRVDYRKSFNNEIKAAIAYDRLALYLFGEGARINFEHRRDKFLKQNLEKFFNWIRDYKCYTSMYNGVYFGGRRAKTWICVCRLQNGKRKTKYCSTEHEAAVVFDLMCLFYNIDKHKLNFPDQLEHYYTLNLEAEINKKTPKPVKVRIKKLRKRIYPVPKNIVFDKSRNKRFRASITKNDVTYTGKRYDNLEDALKSLEELKIRLGINE